nr:hypothetical protein [uncultured Desulfuromonas sp.]
MPFPAPSIAHLASLHHLSQTHALPIYVVGGALRDTLLQRPCHDIDLITPGDPTSIAQAFAQQQAGHWFWLDQKRLYSRVILKQRDTILQYDFAPFRAETLHDDLRLRDFTINAIACPLDDLSGWIDPFGGQADLENRLLRECSPQSFSDDPLRMLKGLRHCAQFELSVEEVTWQHCQQHAPQLARMAGERIRQELALLFAQASPQRAVHLFHQSGLAQAINLPDMEQELFLPHSDQEQRGRLFPQAATAYNYDLCDEFTLSSFAKLCHYISQLNLDSYKLHEVLSGLKMSRKATRLVTFFHHLQRVDATILHHQTTSDRVRLLWLEDLKAPLPDALLLLAVMERRAVMQTCWQRLYGLCDQLLVNGRVRPLVDGKRLKELFPDAQGKSLGKMLQRLRQAELKGKVDTPQQAENYLIRWCESH